MSGPQGGVVWFTHMRADPPGGTRTSIGGWLDHPRKLCGFRVWSSVRFLFRLGYAATREESRRDLQRFRAGNPNEFSAARSRLKRRETLFPRHPRGTLRRIYKQVAVTPLEQRARSGRVGLQVLLKYEAYAANRLFKIRVATTKCGF